MKKNAKLAALAILVLAAVAALAVGCTLAVVNARMPAACTCSGQCRSAGTETAAAGDAPSAQQTEPSDPDSISIPGFDFLSLQAGTQEQSMPLYNPENNACYFRISLLLDGEALETEPEVEGTRQICLLPQMFAGTYTIGLQHPVYQCADITEYDDAIRVESAYRLHRANVKTMPYPGFPTDMQPQLTVCLATAVGTSLVTEGVYDNRFRYTAELGRMGANIQVEGKTAIIDGVQTLRGCEIRACDLRAGAAMVIAAMCAEGMTLIEDAHFIERGYEDIVGKLTALGAHIRRIETYETPSVSEDAG